MSAPTKPRKRAVRLTSEAHDALRRALVGRWQRDERVGRLTREAQAELIGVSVATAGRILFGKGVDRATLALAFKSLGLAWDDSLCEQIQDDEEPAPSPPKAVEPAPAEGPLGRPPGKTGVRYTLGALLCLVVVAGWWISVGSAPAFPAWKVEFNAELAEGTARYHRSDYAGARASLDRAIVLAREHDSAGRLAASLHLEGSLAEAEGELREARDLLREVRDIRTQIHEDLRKPTILEALGEIERRLGEHAAARESLTQALEGYRRFNDPIGVALVQRNLGSLDFAVGNLDSAERLFQTSLSASARLGKRDIVADIRGRRALLLLKRGRAVEARDALRACLDHWTAEAHSRWIAQSRLNLALAEAALDDLPSASARMAQSKAGFERVGDKAGAAEAASHLRRFAARTKKA